MGLDMYLTGRKFLWTRWDLEGEAREAATRKEDGIEIEAIELKLGYWRKHSHLHGYIVRNFAGGVDDCKPIELNADNLKQIISAVEQKALPETAGFFFGNSSQNGWMDDEGTAESLTILRAALAWLEGKSEHDWRSVGYRASW